MASEAISMQVTVDGTNTGQYLKGPNVTGNVAITVHEAVKYHSIEAVLICQSTVDMHDRATDAGVVPEKDAARLVHMFDKIVLKQCDSDAQEELDPGAYNFPFTFTVTKNDLPSTFTVAGHAGSGVAYYVESLVIPEKNATEALARTFTYFPFIGTVDIGSDEFMLPIRRQQKWPIGGFICFATKPISLKVELDRSGYCVGEAIRVNATVVNGTGEDLQVYAVLEKSAYCDVRTPRHRRRKHWDPEIVARQNGGGIGPNSTFIGGFDVVIPESSPVTMSLYAEILHLFYELIVTVGSPYRVNMFVKIPITVGCRNSHHRDAYEF